MAMSETVRTIPHLSSLDAVMNATKLWDKVDRMANITLLAPTNKADEEANTSGDLSAPDTIVKILRGHVLNMPVYVDLIADGTKVGKVRGKNTVEVKVNADGEMWFGPSKVQSGPLM